MNTFCPRCGGLMVADRFFDLLDDTGQLQFMAARCVSCGEVLDPVILENRLRREAARAAAAAPAPAELESEPLESIVA